MVSAVRAAMTGRKKGGPTISVPSGTYENIAIDPGDAVCTLSFNTDGSCSVSAGTSPSASNWASPSATGSEWDVSFDGAGTWLNLGTTRSISASKTVGIGTNQNGPLDVRIRNASSLATVATGSITLLATVDG